MSIFDIVDEIFSGSNKNKTVSPNKIKKWRNSLSYKLSESKRDDFETIFSGLPIKEIDNKIAWLRENPSKHNFTANEIELIEAKISSKS